ncbi:hypothetical protein T08_14072 [Trichinella sp. T8]|nr:hypothetical protein T08_14072 [Trichinella sp. T8]
MSLNTLYSAQIHSIYIFILNNIRNYLTFRMNVEYNNRRLINRFVPTFALTELTDNGEREV